MPVLNQDEITQALQDLLQKTPPPAWLLEMIEHYRRTGAFRPDDLRRLTGDPTKGVRVHPDASVDAILASLQNPAQG